MYILILFFLKQFTVKRNDSDHLYGFPAFLRSHHFCVYLNWLVSSLSWVLKDKSSDVSLCKIVWRAVILRAFWVGRKESCIYNWKTLDTEDKHICATSITHQTVYPTPVWAACEGGMWVACMVNFHTCVCGYMPLTRHTEKTAPKLSTRITRLLIL